MKVGLLQAIDEKSQVERRYPPLGLAYIASYLEKYGGLSNVVFRRDPQELIQEKPDLVGISAVTHNFSQAIRSAQEIKRTLGVPVVVGGPHISALPRTLQPCFDAGVLGEGEETFLELCRQYQALGHLDLEGLNRTSGIVFHGDGGPVVTAPRPLIQPLDRIPFPRRDLFQEPWDSSFPYDMHMLTSRGCPYKCIFCFSTQYWGHIRFFSPQYVVEEIRDLVENWGARSINLYDDLFIANRARLREIVALLEQGGLRDRVRLSCSSVRADLLDEEVCLLLVGMNVQAVGFGAESGSQRVLAYLKNHTTTVENNQRAIDLCQKHGLQLFASFILGSPGEEAKDVMETYEFIRRNAPKFHAVDVYPLTPYPGTPIWDQALSQGLVSEDMDWEALAQDPQVWDVERAVLLNEKVSREQFYLLFRLFQHLCQELRSAKTLSELSQALKAQEAEIARLRDMVEGFRGGRVMKLLMGAQEIGRRMGLRRQADGRVSP